MGSEMCIRDRGVFGLVVIVGFGGPVLLGVLICLIDNDGCVFLEEELEDEMEEFPKFSDVKYDKEIRS